MHVVQDCYMWGNRRKCKESGFHFENALEVNEAIGNADDGVAIAKANISSCCKVKVQKWYNIMRRWLGASGSVTAGWYYRCKMLLGTLVWNTLYMYEVDLICVWSRWGAWIIIYCTIQVQVRNRVNLLLLQTEGSNDYTWACTLEDEHEQERPSR